MRYLTSDQLSPIARKQAVLHRGYMPAITQPARLGHYHRMGYLGLTGTAGGAAMGAKTGASVGSVIPGIGTAIGAVGGAIGGAIAGALGGRPDQEVSNFNQAIALWQQNPASVFNLADKYLVLAGIMDLTPQQAGQIRIYKKYGRRGEERFTYDLANLIYTAAQQGKITANDTPLTIYQRLVLPWEDSWGLGPEPPNPHSDFMDKLIAGLVYDYTNGFAPNGWRAVGGDLPASFKNIQPFSLPQAAPVALAPPQSTPIAPTPTAPVSTAPAPTTTVAIPAGYAQVGVDAQSGIPVYQGLDGRVYEWTGTAMQPLTGQAVIGGQLFTVQNGTVQTPQAAPQIPAAIPPPVDSSQGPAPQPTTAPVPAAAGVTGTGLPSWVTYGAIAGAAYLILATARPAGKPRRAPR